MNLPSPQVQADLATAIRQSVRDVTQSDGSFRCQLDGAAAAIVASALTGARYTPRLLRIPTLICTGMSGSARWYEFVSALRRPGMGVPPETAEKYQIEHCYAECGDVILDVSTWQLRSFFRDRFGVNWDFAPTYYWGRTEDLPRPVHPWYSVSVVTDHTEEYFAALPQLRDTVEAIVRRAAKLLKDKGHVFQGNLFPEWLLGAERDEACQAGSSAAA